MAYIFVEYIYLNKFRLNKFSKSTHHIKWKRNLDDLIKIKQTSNFYFWSFWKF